MADKQINIQALGQAMDSTFTRSSASSGPVIDTHSVKASFTGSDKVMVKIVYTCIVNMVRDKELQASKVMYEKEGDSYIDAAAKQIAKDYKEAMGETVKLKRANVETRIEIVDLNIYNNTRTALFRRVATFEAS